MPSVDVEVEVYCDGCGAGLCNNTRVGTTRGRGQQYFSVSPCEKCIDQAKDEAFKEGRQAGYNERLQEESK